MRMPNQTFFGRPFDWLPHVALDKAVAGESMALAEIDPSLRKRKLPSLGSRRTRPNVRIIWAQLFNSPILT